MRPGTKPRPDHRIPSPGSLTRLPDPDPVPRSEGIKNRFIGMIVAQQILNLVPGLPKAGLSRHKGGPSHNQVGPSRRKAGLSHNKAGPSQLRAGPNRHRDQKLDRTWHLNN